MQGNDAIEVVAPLGGENSEVTLFPDAAAVLAGSAGVLVEPGRIFHAAGRHPSSPESDVALFVRRIEIPVIGRDGEIAGVLCRNSPRASRSTPLTQDQYTAIASKAAKTILNDIINLLATIDCELWLLRQAVGPGSGLGLGQVQQFVEKSGGAIEIKCEIGVGTVVQ